MKPLFKRQSQALRQEYGWVSDADYRAARIGVMAGFLERERIYHTGQLFTSLEPSARP